MLSFTRLPSHPPPLFSSSSSSLLCQSLSLPRSVSPFSVVMPLFLCPSNLLFIHHRSLPPSLPPSCHCSLPPADDAWCDGDWLRNSQREETAGRGWNEKRVVTSGEAWGRTGQRNERNQRRKWVKKTWAIERQRERTANMHCDTLAFIEYNTAPITMQIIICKRTWGEAARSLSVISNLWSDRGLCVVRELSASMHVIAVIDWAACGWHDLGVVLWGTSES